MYVISITVIRIRIVRAKYKPCQSPANIVARKASRKIESTKLVAAAVVVVVVGGHSVNW